jgi:hypothetical protein
MSYHEKRKRKRVAFNINTSFVPENGEPLPCVVQDISMSGFFLQTEKPFSQQTKGTVTIHLQFGDESKEVRAECVVARCIEDTEKPENSGMAVQIIQIDPDSSITLFNMVRYQSESSAKSNL